VVVALRERQDGELMSSNDVMIGKLQGARDGDFEFFTVLELVLGVSS